MDSRWWLMYKGVRYLEVDAPRVVVTHNSKEVISEVDEWEVHDKWAAQIWLLHGNEISLGLYPTMLEAAYAYDVAFTCLGGESMLNFHRHPIYEQIPRNFPYLPLEVLVAKLTKVVKEFGKLAMEGGYYGTIQQEMTLMDFLDMSSVKKSAHDENMFLNSNAQQAGDLNNFQENKRLSFSDISSSDGDLQDWINSCLLDNEKLLAIVSNAYENVSETLPLYPNISALNISDPWPTIELANTRNKQPRHLVSPSHDMLLRSPDGALKFTMADLNIISGNFSESLTVGQGDSGSVYRGQFKDGTTVVVKRIKKIIQASDQNDKNVLEIEDTKDLQTRIGILSKEEHSNMVRLLGFLEDENEQILVTEYVTNGNLRQHLDGVPYKVILDMSKRCRISVDVVAALKHLHNQTNDDLDIIYRDIKSSDVLITNDFHAKVAGFGLLQHSAFGDVGASSSNTQVKKTSGYMAFEHSIAHHLKEKNDVYSFGELLVEIFTGKRLIESNLPSDECFTPRWVLKKCAEGRLTDIIDPKITPTTFDLKILEQIFKLAASCLVLEESSHPTVEDVFRDLSFIVGHYFGDLKHQSNFEEDKYKIQKEQKWDHEACITPNSQTLCLEESEALRRQEPTKHLDKIDSSSPSFMPIELDGSLFVEGSKSNKDMHTIGYTVRSGFHTSSKSSIRSVGYKARFDLTVVYRYHPRCVPIEA